MALVAYSMAMQVPLDAADAFRDQLLSQERLLWSGTPDPNIRLAAADALMIPFSLMWGGFAIFWNWGVWHSRAPIFFRLWGLPFLAVGLYLMVGRFPYDAWMRGRTFYAVTNQRALIATFAWSKSVQSFPLSQLGSTTLQEHADGLGSILFEGQRPPSRGRGGRAAAPGFRFISDAPSVASLLRGEQLR